MTNGVDDDDLDGFENFEASAWFAAIRAADRWRDTTKPGRKKYGDLGRLVDLLRTRLVDAGGDVTLTRTECELLIDLLSRHQLNQKRGGRKLPAYKRASWAELRLEIAAETVRYYQRKGLSFEKAVERTTAPKGYVTAAALRSRMRGKLHPDRHKPSN